MTDLNYEQEIHAKSVVNFNGNPILKIMYNLKWHRGVENVSKLRAYRMFKTRILNNKS